MPVMPVNGGMPIRGSFGHRSLGGRSVLGLNGLHHPHHSYNGVYPVTHPTPHVTQPH